MKGRLYVALAKAGAPLPGGLVLAQGRVVELEARLARPLVDAGQLAPLYEAPPGTPVQLPPPWQGPGDRDCPGCGQSPRRYRASEARWAWMERRLWTHERNMRRAYVALRIGLTVERACALWARHPGRRGHATLTYGFVRLVAAYDGPWPPPPGHELWDRRAVQRHYSPARLAEGRAEVVEPDLQPLP